jgi:hypothetical protein
MNSTTNISSPYGGGGEERIGKLYLTDSNGNGNGMAFLMSATLLYLLLRRMGGAALVMLFFGISRILGAKFAESLWSRARHL